MLARATETLILLVGVSNGTTALENWQFLKESNTLPLYDLKIPLLGIYTREMKTYVHLKTWIRMFIVALYIIDKLEIAQMPLNCDTTIIEWYLDH